MSLAPKRKQRSTLPISKEEQKHEEEEEPLIPSNGNNKIEDNDVDEDDDDTDYDPESGSEEGFDVVDSDLEDEDEDQENDDDDDIGNDADYADGMKEVEQAFRDYLLHSEDGDGVDDEDGDGDYEAGQRSEDDSDNEGNEEPTVPESDSSEDEVEPRNTIGDVPLKWYKDEEHIGYDVSGRKLKKQAQKDQLDTFLAQSDNSRDWRKVYDEYNDEMVELTREEIDMIKRIRSGKVPHAEVNPYQPYVDWFDWDGKGHPLSNAPEPKRRFIPSKWEAKKVVKLVRALRNGWLKLEKPKEKPRVYMLWGDDLQTSEKTANGLAYIPAPKLKLPGHEESYNPPEEYVPTQEELNSYELIYEEDRPAFIPRRFESLRQVPAYAKFINERFERCLDLYLCPRTRKKRINIDPETLVPKLPKPQDLKPYPTTCFLEYRGHTDSVSSISVESTGQWLASGSVDGTVRLWEVQTGRCRRVWNLGGRIRSIAWNPVGELPLIAVAVEKEVIIINTEVNGETAHLDGLLTEQKQETSESSDEPPLAAWKQHANFRGLKIIHQQIVESVAWHHKGDYLSSVAPDGNTRAVLIHQLSKQQTQNPFRKHHGRVVCVLFHPSRPFLYLASKTHVRIYNLAKQQLSKKLVTGLQEISSMAAHPGGDHLIVGSRDARLCWFDMDLSTKPYKTIKNHKQDINAVCFHQSYPLFASCSDDATAHVFHGMVYSDLLQNPLIVPLKILYGSGKGVLDCTFHPRQPWLFTGCSDSIVRLYCN